jgi:hypothetical protein
MGEAQRAGELLVALRATGKSCATCPYQAAMEKGEETPEDCCSVEQCVLTDFNMLSASRTWRWMAELLAFEACGLTNLGEVVKSWPIDMVRAFVVFRSTITTMEQERAAQEAEWRRRSG